MKVFVTQFSFDGAEKEEFGSAHTTFEGAVAKATDALEYSKKELEEDPEMILTIQGPTQLDDGSQVVQMVNEVGTEIEFWRIKEVTVEV